ncbi:MAG: hypothetical protein A3J66_02390 [Candidatus Magasanikbacteria bacterium RIFCSPHIGHO2_02_FULL_47_14]|uniref:Methyltransferase domain-containing protein n=1 Tax=Candidatus Magasanikbacteria bacterium RIFCSPHIGHO2_02_FULL_47_14 TaxID=1798680 RepID=A0A1F6M1H8_9BACT|nr:MAG: hypothetical protein A3J66_02390 [Candidatus Magasanikbacteria bacterium RIFCSPHIGHO2_02_FULL_47_14]
MDPQPQKYLPPLSWSALTSFYDFFCSLFGLGKKFKRKILDCTQLSDDMAVVDIGCGTGVFLEMLKRKYPRVSCIGVDPDAKALSIAQRRLKRAGLAVELNQAFAQSLPLGDHSVDLCVSTLAFHHMPNEVKRQAMKEIYRVLKPGGHVVIADFGKSEGTFLRKVLFFEKLEYLEGNLKGYIENYIKEVGFHSYEIVGRHFPGINIVRARK